MGFLMSDKLDTAVAGAPKPFFVLALCRTSVALILPFLIVSLALQLPGNVPYDGIMVWYQAETGRIFAQHPPTLVAVWHLTELLMRGPALFTLVQLLCLWTAGALLVSKLRPPIWLAVLFYLALLFYPPVFAYSALTVKDAFGAHLAVLAFVIAMPARGKPLGLASLFAAFACAVLATLVRYQLGLVEIALVVLLWWDAHDDLRTAMRKLSAGMAGAITTYGISALTVFVLFTHSGSGDVQLSFRKMMIFDIAGVVVNNPSAGLPVFARAGVDVRELKDMIRTEYSPVRVDTLWQENDVGDSLSAQLGAFGRLATVSNHEVLQQWLFSAHNDFGALMQHRANAFGRVLGFSAWLYECRPLRYGISPLPPKPAAFVHSKSYTEPISTTVLQSPFFPVGLFFRSWLYLVISLTIVAAGFFGAPREAVLLSGFALFYEASFFFLPQACEVRYSYPEMLATIFALAILAFTARRRLSE
jgi:hypothetical protein